MFTITSGRISAGVRRIEALTVLVQSNGFAKEAIIPTAKILRSKVKMSPPLWTK